MFLGAHDHARAISGFDLPTVLDSSSAVLNEGSVQLQVFQHLCGRACGRLAGLVNQVILPCKSSTRRWCSMHDEKLRYEIIPEGKCVPLSLLHSLDELSEDVYWIGLLECSRRQRSGTGGLPSFSGLRQVSKFWRLRRVYGHQVYEGCLQSHEKDFEV